MQLTQEGGGSPFAAFLIKAGASIIDNMAILFAVGVALGMAKDRDGSAALSGLVGYLVVTTLLSTGTVALLRGIDPSEVNAAFGKIQNQFIGILSGLVAALTSDGSILMHWHFLVGKDWFLL